MRGEMDALEGCILYDFILQQVYYIYIPDIRLVDAYAKLRRTFYGIQERDEERELEETEILG